MSLLLRQRWHTPISLLPSAMAMLLLRIWLGILFNLSVLALVFVARVKEVPVLVLVPQILVAELRLLVLIPILILRLGGDPLLEQKWRWGVLLLVPTPWLRLDGRGHRHGLGCWGSGSAGAGL